MNLAGTRSMLQIALLVGIVLAVMFAAPVSAAERTGDLVVSPEYNAAELEWNTALSWTDPTGSLDGTNILRRVLGESAAGEFTVIATVASGETSYLDENNIRPRTTYVYRVQRISDSRKSNVAGTKLPKVPNVPTGVSLLASSNGITVSWDSPERNNVANFEIYRQSEYETSHGLVGSVEATDTSYQDNGIQIGMTYNYRVMATNVYGGSGGTIPVSITMQPSAPTNLQIVSDDSVTSEQLSDMPRKGLSNLTWDSTHEGLTFRLYTRTLGHPRAQYADNLISPAQLGLLAFDHQEYSVVAVARYTTTNENGETVEHEVESPLSEWVLFGPRIRPIAVESFSITNIGTQLKFEWHHDFSYSYGHRSYKIYRRLSHFQTLYEPFEEYRRTFG